MSFHRAASRACYIAREPGGLGLMKSWGSATLVAGSVMGSTSAAGDPWGEAKALGKERHG